MIAGEEPDFRILSIPAILMGRNFADSIYIVGNGCVHSMQDGPVNLGCDGHPQLSVGFNKIHPGKIQ